MASELPGPQSHDDIANWLLRLSEALTRLNNGLLWAGASPGELERILAPNSDFLTAAVPFIERIAPAGVAKSLAQTLLKPDALAVTVAGQPEGL